MQLTTNLKLKKPEIADAVNIDDLNSNADTIDTEVAKIASTSQAGRMSTTDKTKLDGIQAGAQVNAVTSVASRTGAVTLSKTDVGLSSVDNAKQATKAEFDSHVVDEVKHITAAERTTWNAKASTAAATTSVAGLMAAGDKSKLDGIATGAQTNRSIATQLQAEASTDNTTDMTPLRTLQSIDSRTRYGVTTGMATAFVLNLSPTPTSLYAGIEVKIKLHVKTGTNPTLNVNGLGAKALYDSDGARFSGESGKIYSFIYDGANFILSSGGGGGKLNVYTGATGWPDTGNKAFQGIVLTDTLPINNIVVDTHSDNVGEFYSGPVEYSAAFPIGTYRQTESVSDGVNIYYVTGGTSNGSTAVNFTLHRFTPSTNTWTVLANMASVAAYTLEYPVLGINNDYIYIFNGNSNSGLRRVFRYTISTNIWTDTGVASESVWSNGTVANIQVASIEYLVGGGISTTTTDRYWKFDYSTGLITVFAKRMPMPLMNVCLAYYGGEIIAFGGNKGSNNISNNTRYIYDILMDTWREDTTNIAITNYVITKRTGFVQTEHEVFFTVDNNNISYNGLLGSYNLATFAPTIRYISPLTDTPHYLAKVNDSIVTFERGSTNESRGFVQGRGARFMLIGKTYPANTIVIIRTNENRGIHYTELVGAPKLTGVNTRLITGFDDVYYYNGSTILKQLPTYYGTGTQWIRFK